MGTNNRKEILRLLRKNKSITSSMIASSVGVSQKTVFNEIKYLREVLPKYGVEINASRVNGYSLKIHDYNKFKEYINSNFDDINTKEARTLEVILLLINHDGISLGQLSYKLYISIPQISKDIKALQAQIKKYDLDIEKSNRGFKITGSELKKRQLIVEYIYYNNLYEYSIAKHIISIVGINQYKKYEELFNRLKNYYKVRLNINTEKLLKLYIWFGILRSNSIFEIIGTKLKVFNEESNIYKFINDICQELAPWNKDESLIFYQNFFLFYAREVLKKEDFKEEVVSLARIHNILEEKKKCLNCDINEQERIEFDISKLVILKSIKGINFMRFIKDFPDFKKKFFLDRYVFKHVLCKIKEEFNVEISIEELLPYIHSTTSLNEHFKLLIVSDESYYITDYIRRRLEKVRSIVECIDIINTNEYANYSKKFDICLITSEENKFNDEMIYVNVENLNNYYYLIEEYVINNLINGGTNNGKYF